MQFLPERGEDHQLPVFIKQISQLFSSILISRLHFWPFKSVWFDTPSK